MQVNQEVAVVDAWLQQSTAREQALMVKKLNLKGWTHERADEVLRRSHVEVRPPTSLSD